MSSPLPEENANSRIIGQIDEKEKKDERFLDKETRSLPNQKKKE